MPLAIAPVATAPVVPVVIPVEREASPVTPDPAPPFTLNTIWPASDKDNQEMFSIYNCARLLEMPYIAQAGITNLALFPFCSSEALVGDHW